jgi:hypothetical protein
MNIVVQTEIWAAAAASGLECFLEQPMMKLGTWDTEIPLFRSCSHRCQFATCAEIDRLMRGRGMSFTQIIVTHNYVRLDCKSSRVEGRFAATLWG